MEIMDEGRVLYFAIVASLGFVILTSSYVSLFYPHYHRGQVSVETSIETHVLSDLTDPSFGATHGLKGYIRLDFDTNISSLIIVSKLKVLNISVSITFVPFDNNVNETVIRLDLMAPDATGVGYMYDMINPYVVYTPHGNVTLKAREPLNVTMTLRVPEGLDHGMSFPRGMLSGIGIITDNMAIVDNLNSP